LQDGPILALHFVQCLQPLQALRELEEVVVEAFVYPWIARSPWYSPSS
jgi:hypothetical protein